MSFRTERLAHAQFDPQADWSRTRGDEGINKRSEESLSSSQAIGGWKTSAWGNILKLFSRLVNGRYQGFLTPLSYSLVHHVFMTGLSARQAKHGRAAPFGMT